MVRRCSVIDSNSVHSAMEMKMEKKLRIVFPELSIDWSSFIDRLNRAGIELNVVENNEIDEHDITFCQHCNKETMHHFSGYRHERDSSNEMQTCSACGWWSSGMDMEQHPPDGWVEPKKEAKVIDMENYHRKKIYDGIKKRK